MRDWNVYPPDDDTFLLLGAALALVAPGEKVLEVGCGSGFIAAGLLPQADVIGTDINPHALVQSREAGVEVVRTDLLAGIRGFSTPSSATPHTSPRGLRRGSATGSSTPSMGERTGPRSSGSSQNRWGGSSHPADRSSSSSPRSRTLPWSAISSGSRASPALPFQNTGWRARRSLSWSFPHGKITLKIRADPEKNPPCLPGERWLQGSCLAYKYLLRHFKRGNCIRADST